MKKPARALWREPVTWIAIGLPLLTLVAAFFTIRMAHQSSTVAEVSPVQRIAQIQFEDLGADHEAARLGLSAHVVADRQLGTLTVALSDAAAAEDALVLVLRHPMDAGKDRTLALSQDGDLWRGDTAPWAEQSWELRLTNAGGSWRLGGRLSKDMTDVQLIPAVSE